MSVSARTVLQGWKEIAEYLQRDERTAKRWEKQRSLPVRRMPGNGRANVYILVPELEAWLRHTPVDELKDSEPDADESADGQRAATADHARRWRIWGTAAAIILLLVAGGLVLHRTRKARMAAANQASVRYVSRVAGVDDSVLRGLYLYEQRTPDSLQQAVLLFKKATALDPADALAWSGLARTDMLLHEYGLLNTAGMFPEAKFAALRAIELDPKMPEPHAALGFMEFFWFTDAAYAEREFHVALDLDPGSAYTHSLYGTVLTYEGRFNEALDHLDAAQRLQPASTSVLTNRAFALGLSGHREEAVEMLQGIERGGNYPPAAYDLAMLSLVPPQNAAMFLDQVRRLAEATHNDGLLDLMATAAGAWHTSGDAGMWRAIIASQAAPHAKNTDTIYTAIAQAQLGENAAALDTLEQMEHASGPGHEIAILPGLSPLHHEPRFARLVAHTGLPTPP